MKRDRCPQGTYSFLGRMQQDTVNKSKVCKTRALLGKH